MNTPISRRQNPGIKFTVTEPGYNVLEQQEVKGDSVFVKLGHEGTETWWSVAEKEGALTLNETQSVVEKSDGKWINGAPASETNQLRQVGNLEKIRGETDVRPAGFPLFVLVDHDRQRYNSPNMEDSHFEDSVGQKVTVYYSVLVSGDRIMRPGLKFKVEGTGLQRLDFLSLMLALFLGTAALPHILIRYYTVPNPASARKSTIVAIAAIGFFYILTLFMGLGAMTNAVINPADSNMSAPLLARSFGELLFAIISAIAFATVLGTVSGLIVAASGAVAHDLMDRYMNVKMDDRQKVRAGKISAFVDRRISHRAWHPLPGHECHFPGGIGVCGGGLGQPARHYHAAFLEENHRQRHCGLNCGGYRRFFGTDRLFAGNVYTLRLESA